VSVQLGRIEVTPVFLPAFRWTACLERYVYIGRRVVRLELGPFWIYFAVRSGNGGA